MKKTNNQDKKEQLDFQRKIFIDVGFCLIEDVILWQEKEVNENE